MSSKRWATWGVVVACAIAMVAIGLSPVLRTPPQASAAAPLPGIRIKPIKAFSGFARPLYITNAGDGTRRLWVVERAGVIRVLSHGKVVARPWLDIRSQVGASVSERGLLGLAFAPSYRSTGRFYVYYTDRTGAITIARYVADHPRSDTPTVKLNAKVLTIPHPNFANHDGGCIQFGPDGYLMVGTGDGGGAGDPQGNAQNTFSRLGKLLRIDTGDSPHGPLPAGKKYLAPGDNPFIGGGGGGLVWAFGLRNPWRFSFDRTTGDLWIGDVGQNQWEEIDFQAAGDPGGENYGWNRFEGNHSYPPGSAETTRAGLTFPAVEYAHTDATPTPDPNGGDAVVGGYVYRGASFPQLTGVYLYADYIAGRIWGTKRSVTPGGPVYEGRLLWHPSAPFNISSFGQSETGELYITAFNGAVYQIKAF